MRIRNIATATLVGGLALSLAACGKPGAPGQGGEGGKSTIEPPPQMQVAKDVNITGSPTFDRIKQNGKITIGVKDDQPGLGYKDSVSQKFTGFDIDIANYLAAQLGYGPDKIVYKQVQSAGREAAISNGDVDFYVGTYTINDKRKQQVSFAGPYFVAGQDLLVRKDDNSIKGPESLKDKTVCSAKGSTPIQNVKEKNLAKEVREQDKYSDCVKMLQNKQVDAVTTDDAILKGYAAQQSNLFKVVGKTFTKEPYGVGLNKDDKVLRGKLDDYLQKALDDGDWQKFYDGTLGKSGSPAPQKPTIERY
ncbi:glutamate ABC transporter substrate-binding protein [Sciscionella sediminilitoris]|uniref:glutamate ABC transporter substrate-binding protein n=1 Tax=Sciscionella sediminilitoris TaxID=1445613 RepID=UPI0004DF9135|nr:glutamate ABC transporter substrate-binding protein [Sciscionella sp. SE31]